MSCAKDLGRRIELLLKESRLLAHCIVAPPVREKLQFGHHNARVSEDLAQRRWRESALVAGLIILDGQTDRRKSGRGGGRCPRFQGKPGRVPNRRSGERIVTRNEISAPKLLADSLTVSCRCGHYIPQAFSTSSFCTARLA